MATIHRGFIDRRFNNSLKDTDLNDVDISMVRLYKGIKPMYVQLGFLSTDTFSDKPDSIYYWQNIIPADFKFHSGTPNSPSQYIGGIEVRTVEIDDPPTTGGIGVGVGTGSRTPRTSYNKIVIDEASSQEWKKTNDWGVTYYYPVLPRINKYGLFTDKIDETRVFGNRDTGSWNQDDDSAPITNLNEIGDDLILNIDFDQSTTDELIDTVDLNEIHYNQDYEMEIDKDLRIKKSTTVYPDSIEKENTKQAF
tara:strand:+ start:249 stop:1001 length:753 start_codon:yes stop_codon:yes gene_type:complete